MPFVSSFPPVSNARARVLILGSIPGVASLEAGQYYAHPRNHFWPIMGALTNAGPQLAYETRLQILKDKDIAVWDVLQSCAREGSLDSAIGNEFANDFETFFKMHPDITHVFFNGTKAESAFRKFVPPEVFHSLNSIRLPSTSPANASWSFERKLEAWRQALEQHLI